MKRICFAGPLPTGQRYRVFRGSFQSVRIFPGYSHLIDLEFINIQLYIQKRGQRPHRFRFSGDRERISKRAGRTVTQEPEVEVGRHKFEWDEHKRQANLAKHGIDFLDVPAVFDDPHRFTYRSKHPEHEIRHVTVGRTRNTIVAVVSTARGNTLRIISIRVARKQERERYGRRQEEQN